MAKTIKTDAREAHDELHEELSDSRVLQGDFATKNYTVTTARLQTNLDEIDILRGTQAMFRKGYEQDDKAKTIQIPAIFAKVDGITKDESKYQSKLDKIRNSKGLELLVDMHLETNSDWELQDSDAETLISNMTVDAFIANDAWEYDILDRNGQEKIASAIISVITDWPFSFEKNNESIKHILQTGLDLPRELLEIIQEVDYPKQVPFLAYLQSAELGTITKTDIIGLCIFNALGWDVVVYSPYAYASLENHIKTDEFDKFNLETVKASKFAKGNKHSIFGKIFGL